MSPAISRELLSKQLTHRLASEINRALADANMTIAELAKKIGHSPAFIRRVLAGEDGLADKVKLGLLADVAWATGQWMSLAVSPISDVVGSDSVKGGE